MRDANGNIICDESSSAEEWEEFFNSMTEAQLRTLELILTEVEGGRQDKEGDYIPDSQRQKRRSWN
jgi:hypothetical protein